MLTAQEDGGSELDDAGLMDRALEIGRVVFTQDRDFLIEADRRQESGAAFAGVVYAHQLNVTVGQCVADLELIAKIYEPAEMADRVEYLPLR